MIKVKYKGKWISPEEAAFLREQERQEASARHPEPPPIDVDQLPAPEALNPDVPLQQLFFENREVRPYITAAGKMRGGLSPSQKQTAQDILTRYRESV